MRGFPWLLLYQWLSFGDLSALGFVAVVDGAAAGFPLRRRIQWVRQGIHQNATYVAAEYAAQVEGHPAGTHDGNSSSVAKGNGIFVGDEDRIEHRADDADVTLGC